jgi:UPF0755 protein
LRGRILLLSLCLVLASAGTAGWAWHWYRTPLARPADTVLVIPKGAARGEIGRDLAMAGIVTRPWLFAVAARLTASAGPLRTGEYAFAAAMSPAQVLELLRSGRTVIHRLVVPEGLSTPAVLALVEGAEALQGSVTQPPGEGELLPDTYFYSWGDDRQALIDRMRRAFRRELADLWAKRPAGLPIADPREAVILASIVEKETAIAAERPLIAGVFYNRLRLGMRLQSDPTTIYALTRGRQPLGRPLDHADLDVDSPYNTYAVTGLPPGPIDNPGRASLAAAIDPAPTDALYFVANGDGGHSFAASLEEHNANVAKWRKRAPAQKPQTPPG